MSLPDGAGPEERDSPSPDVAATGDRIQLLLDASAAGGAVARERAEELVRLVADLYGAGLERLLDLLHELGRLDDTVLAALADDELVSSLLLVHGLHPYDTATRVEQALASVRPYLGSHGGDVELLEVSSAGVVRLRLLGSCDGCASSSATLSLAVEGAIEAAAPEVTAISVVTTPEPAAIISVDSLRSRLPTPDAGPERNLEPIAVGGSSWESGDELAGLAPGALATFELAGTPIVACRVGADLYAFCDRCPRCRRSLLGASVARRLGGAADDAVLTCPGCHCHFDVRHAGRSLDDDLLHLDPLPLLVTGSRISVAVPIPVTA